MTRDQQHNPDPNLTAARIVAGSTRDHSKLTAERRTGRFVGT